MEFLCASLSWIFCDLQSVVYCTMNMQLWIQFKTGNKTVCLTESTVYRQYDIQTVWYTDSKLCIYSMLYRQYGIQKVRYPDSMLYRHYATQTVRYTDSMLYTIIGLINCRIVEFVMDRCLLPSYQLHVPALMAIFRLMN